MESDGGADVARVLAEIQTLKSARNDIDNRISALQSQLRDLTPKTDAVLANGRSFPPLSTVDSGFGHGLTADMIHRYSRQLLLPSFGVQAQANLLKSSILVVGAGGLGSPALLYLAACGAGRLGIVDHDVVELNNMHRQKYDYTYTLEVDVTRVAETLEDIRDIIKDIVDPMEIPDPRQVMFKLLEEVEELNVKLM